MKVVITNEITVTNPPIELVEWCKKNLIIPNPEYQKKRRMGKWTGNTPDKLYLYKVFGESICLPYGILPTIKDMLGNYTEEFPAIRKVDYNCEVPLYDYQAVAVENMLQHDCGVLQSKAGSGKTQMGIAMIAKLGCRTLWLTHTAELLKQSRDRAALYTDSSLFGEITAGKVNIGKGITFATVQTLAKQDPDTYKNAFDCVIVDECHRVAGTPTSVTQFGKVLSNLNCRYKYGLSATVHRADGLIKTMFAYLGKVAYTVPDEAVADKVMDVFIYPKPTHTLISEDCLDTDGTIIYQNLISYLVKNSRRNFMIANDLADNSDHYCLILSDRVEHLKQIMSLMPQEMCAMIDGKMVSKKARAERECAMEDIRSGKKHYLFATYRLAKEGIDIPRLDRLFLTTPQKDYAIVVQSVGRIARTFEGKSDPVCYDYVDNIGYLIGAYKKRCSHYKKCGCQFLGGLYDT